MQDHFQTGIYARECGRCIQRTPSLRKRFMKKLTRDRVVPIISANVSCEILGINVSGSPGSPNSAISRRILGQTFLAGIQKLINKIGLDPHTACQ